MLVLGLVLILLSAGTLVAVLSSGTDDHARLFGGAIDVSTLVVFLAGAAALLVFIMGLELVRSGVRRANANRKTKKTLRTLEKREEQRTDAPAGTTSPGTTTTGTTTTGTTSTGTTSTGTTAPDGPSETPPPTSR